MTPLSTPEFGNTPSSTPLPSTTVIEQAERLSAVEKQAILLYRAEEQRANALAAQVQQLTDRLDAQAQAHQRTLSDLQKLRARYDDILKKLATAPVEQPSTRAPWERDL